ncbi:galactokinase [Sphingomonas sp.]|uniref:galactokinase n=1 Tax=Sphingomonas sp. TaxID=28214 RepID=UPI001DA1C52A|nr:galactokinase [Sphingomonas sp.]MBX9795721.1 galactokinase [Sphingomonas sp.]
MSAADHPEVRAQTAYRARFGAPPAGIAYAPGRVNLIGEHTDYNDGFVLPLAIDRGTAVAFGTGEGGSIAVSADYGEEDAVPAGGFAPAPGWRAHVRAALAAFADAGGAVPALRLAIAGDVPQGAGLSSSASLGVALVGALDALDGGRRAPTDIARIAQAAENRYVGTACGIMDQLAAAAGVDGHALLIDCRSLAVTPVPIPPDMAVLIVHSGIARGLVDSAYNARRAACEAAAAAMGVPALRDADMAMLTAATLDDEHRARARHVISENARVLALPPAIASRDWGAIGTLMAASHASMRDDFQITLPPIDALVARLAAAAGGQGGARMTGGGFGGCVVALADTGRLSALTAAAHAHFADTGTPPALIHACRPAAGLRVDRGARP